MPLTDEVRWYFLQNGFYRVREPLPEELVDRLNVVTDVQVEEKIEPIIWEKEESLGARVIRRLSKILDRDPVYFEAALSSRARSTRRHPRPGRRVTDQQAQPHHGQPCRLGRGAVACGRGAIQPGANHRPDLPGRIDHRKRLHSNRAGQPPASVRRAAAA